MPNAHSQWWQIHEPQPVEQTAPTPAQPMWPTAADLESMLSQAGAAMPQAAPTPVAQGLPAIHFDHPANAYPSGSSEWWNQVEFLGSDWMPGDPTDVPADPFTPTGVEEDAEPNPEDNDPMSQPSARRGPQIAPSRELLNNGKKCRTCQTCGNATPLADTHETVDHIHMCVRCHGVYAKCTYCGGVIPADKFKGAVFAHFQCKECGPQRKARLNVKQAKAFEIKADVIGRRRDTVWTKRSS